MLPRLVGLARALEIAAFDPPITSEMALRWGLVNRVVEDDQVVEAALAMARELCERHRALRLGLVDGVVVAVAERLRADAIATLDYRHLGAIEIIGSPLLLPRDRGPART